jgi:CheY-like chemotaxis protein
MNGVIGFTDLLLETSLTPEQQSMASTIRDSGRALMTIIDDILDFSRIEAGRVTIERARVDAKKIAHDVLTLLRPRAAEKKLDFEVQWPDTISTSTIADAGRLRQVLVNLASNAIKFTDNGRVTIRAASESEGTVRIEVEDTGIGITPEQLPRLFAKFTQADSSTTRKYGGTGLGLAISKQLVELMNGQIGGASEPGVGSKFWFTLPLAQRSETTGSHRVLTLDASLAPANQQSISAAHPRVLIVEDHAVNRMLATRLLAKLGCEVDLAENGRFACERTSQQAYDLIFMDCQMPEMDGFEATRVIRDRERSGGGAHTPIVALTANAMSQDRERCIEAGMDDYITKPYSGADFERVLQRWCRPQALPAVGIEK